ncbi:MAG: ParB/RepB/Spo0J family partition protein [Bifidobacterium tibiigranuli]|jgi:ParB family chromosome partitioning protein|nr:ParB/RepB/Spo0J family partition protein [Bifidobacterium tibiigranuli]
MDNQIINLSVEHLHPHPSNPRRDVGDVKDLADSISAQGIKQNLLVVPQDADGEYTVIIGHRRLAAAKLAGIQEVPCKIERLDARQQLELMIVENSQRSDLRPIEEADAYQGLLDLGATRKHIAEKTGRSSRYVGERLKISKIPAEVRALSADFAQLSLMELQALAEFEDDRDVQVRLAQVAGTGNWDWELSQARRARDEAKWLEGATAEIHRLGLAYLPEELRPEYTWDNPKGYEHATWFGCEDGTFAKQWREWAKGQEHVDKALVMATDDRVHVYLPKAGREESAAEKKLRRQRAEERQRKRDAQQLDSDLRGLRETWVHANLHGLSNDAKRALIEGLALADLMTGTDWGVGALRGDSNWDDLLIQSYNRMASKPLPVTEKDTKNGIYHLLEKTNILELRERQRSHPLDELLLLLLARREASINYETWSYPGSIGEDYRQRASDYIGLLCKHGYQPCDAEKKALAGEGLNS